MCIIDFLNYQPFGYDKSMAITAWIFGVFWFVVYNVYVLWHINGICKDHKTFDILPKSISQSYYMIDVRWLFKMFMFSSIFAILCICQNVLYVIVGLFFLIMTVNPSVNSGDRYLIPHMVGAISAITLCILGMGICWNLWGMVIATVIDLLITFILLRKDSHLVYVIELVSLIMFMCGAELNLIVC